MSEDELVDAAVKVWVEVIEMLADEFDNHGDTVVSASSILAGIGVVAHHTMPMPPRDAGVVKWTVDEVLEVLDGVDWKRDHRETGAPYSVWDGVGGKHTPSGSYSVGGPQEVGHAVAAAIETPDSPNGKQIRS